MAENKDKSHTTERTTRHFFEKNNLNKATTESRQTMIESKDKPHTTERTTMHLSERNNLNKATTATHLRNHHIKKRNVFTVSSKAIHPFISITKGTEMPIVNRLHKQLLKILY